jgi:hypothetical protein
MGTLTQMVEPKSFEVRFRRFTTLVMASCIMPNYMISLTASSGSNWKNFFENPS